MKLCEPSPMYGHGHRRVTVIDVGIEVVMLALEASLRLGFAGVLTIECE